MLGHVPQSVAVLVAVAVVLPVAVAVTVAVVIAVAPSNFVCIYYVDNFCMIALRSPSLWPSHLYLNSFTHFSFGVLRVPLEKIFIFGHSTTSTYFKDGNLKLHLVVEEKHSRLGRC